MGFFSKKISKGINTSNNSQSPQSFVMGVLDVFQLLNSKDLVVVGHVKGTVSVGAAVYASNVGDDDGQIFLTTVLGIETGPNQTTKEATDCTVGLKLEKGKSYPFKKGTVLYTRDQSVSEVHSAYIGALGDTYVAKQNLELSDQEIESLSITDCAEIWRLFIWYKSQSSNNESEEQIKLNQGKVNRLAAALCKKILNAKEIFYVQNKATGEPYLYSKTMKQNDEYVCTPPDILIFTKAYAEMMKKAFPEEKFEIVRVDNGGDGKGIYNFLGSTFYLNGACGVQVVSEQTAISAQMLVPEPDYSNVRPQDIPVTNPNLVRWMLLIGQMEKIEGNDAELIYKLYYRFLSREVRKARFLIPMKNDSQIPQPDEDGKTILEKGTNLQLATMDGKYDRPALLMYTDWKRLRMRYDEQWGGLIQTIDGVIHTFDCAINATQYPKAGSYIDQEMFLSATT